MHLPLFFRSNKLMKTAHAQGRPKTPPAMQNASRKSSGDKNKEVRGQNLPFCFKGK